MMPRRRSLSLSFALLLFVLHGTPAQADNLIEAVSGPGVTASRRGKTLWLDLSPEVLKRGSLTIPRLCAPLRSLGWKGKTDAALKFVPEPTEWVISWKNRPVEVSTIELVFDVDPVLPSSLEPISPTGDGSVLLHAYQASTSGEKLRFEPQWYKNTVGYWTVPTDHATWTLSIDQPGTFSVAVLQGCGNGQGGSSATLSLSHGDASYAPTLSFTTIDTGHFQNFRWNHLGTIGVEKPGTYTLKIAPVHIAKNALFDVRMIHLVRQAKPPKTDGRSR